MGNSQNKLENDYLSLSKQKLRLYYREVYKNPYNVYMALEKKYYDKIVSMRTNMLSIEKLGSIDWKVYIINYFERIGKEEKLIWYNELASEVENELFFSQKKYTSCAFYKDFELKNKPIIFENLCNYDNDENDYEEKLIDSLSKNIFKDNINANLTLSKIDINNPQNDNLKMSINSMINESFNANELGHDIINVKKRVKEILKIFKNHISNKDHPIYILIQIFGNKISNIIQQKNNEFKTFKNKDKQFKENVKNTCNEMVRHIQNFVIKCQTTLKLMYSKAIDLECFYEEKDESINIISTVLFNIDSLYKNIFQLFSFLLEDEVIKFAKILKVVQKLTPKDLKIPSKFSLDDETIKLQEEIFAKKKYDFDSNINIDTIINKNPIHYLTASIKKIKQLDNIKVPYVKMMKIASISSTITKNINIFWKGMEKYINPYFLNITADELIIIYLFIIIKSDYPKILIHEKLIQEFTTRTTKSTTIGYYNTTINASIEYINKEIIKEYKLEKDLEQIKDIDINIENINDNFNENNSIEKTNYSLNEV